MTLEQIKAAVAAGRTVHWSNDGYDVIRDNVGQWLIIYRPNRHCIGLTHADGVTMNGRPDEFYLAPLDHQTPFSGKQDALNRLWDWFVVQKQPPGTADTGFCAYRGPGGCRCGIGLLIPDAEYPAEGIVGAINELLDGGAEDHEKPAVAKLFERAEQDPAFLLSVQHAHDDAQGEGDDEFYPVVEQNLRKLAETHYLAIPA